MTTPVRMTKAQERRFYRNAVEAVLERFYGRSEREASALTKKWWRRLVELGVEKSDLLFHDEPMNTAGDVAHMHVIAISSSNREAYQSLLDESYRLAMLGKTWSTSGDEKVSEISVVRGHRKATVAVKAKEAHTVEEKSAFQKPRAYAYR